MALILATFVFSAETLAQVSVGGQGRSTVLPTDVVPLPLPEERRAVGESMKLRLWQKLPSRFYMNATCETSGRFETNVFQFPTKRTILNGATFNQGVSFGALSGEDQLAMGALVDRASQHDSVFRVVPNVTAGWALTPSTNIFCNYFYLRDKLARFNSLNTFINQLGAGVEHNIALGKRANLEAQFMARELWQADSDPVFDYLPSATFTYRVRPDTIAYFNALGQFRSLHFFGGVDREITPFFTLGALHQRGPWSYSANMTYLTGFRKGFKDASIQLNSQTIICDFEIAKQLFKKIPGLQGFLRAEPVYNFGTDNSPGLAGMDFRFFYGVRGAVSKPSLLAFTSQLKQRYQQDPSSRRHDPNKGKSKSKNQKSNTTSPSKSGKTRPNGSEDSKTEPLKEDLPGGPSAENMPGLPSAEIVPGRVNANVADAIFNNAETITITAAPMHGFITETGKEVADASMISEFRRAKNRVN
ncbi:MAG: hypothetical protein IT342_15840 [Candidatus Melainabacteria bacterium]|nr:hypothetical protein [Candidatus Melainabacteria bacterium]